MYYYYCYRKKNLKASRTNRSRTESWYNKSLTCSQRRPKRKMSERRRNKRNSNYKKRYVLYFVWRVGDKKAIYHIISAYCFQFDIFFALIGSLDKFLRLAAWTFSSNCKQPISLYLSHDVPCFQCMITMTNNFILDRCNTMLKISFPGKFAFQHISIWFHSTFKV